MFGCELASHWGRGAVLNIAALTGFGSFIIIFNNNDEFCANDNGN